MSTALLWTSADLPALPEDGKRYEIIEGELFVSRQPHWHHQRTCGNFYTPLDLWSRRTGLGEVIFTPGVIFTDDDDVAPDVAWVSRERLAHGLDVSGHLTIAPELVIEVLSWGKEHERRDREVKLKLYSRRGVQEYWIADWRRKQIEVYRREGLALRLIATLLRQDTIASPLLPEFSCPVAEIFDEMV